MPQFVYTEREFLNPPTTGKNSYICAIAESSEGGTNRTGDYALVMADCHHAIELEFSLLNPQDRSESLAKIDTIARIINTFRETLHAEAEIIDSMTTHSSPTEKSSSS